MLTQRLILSLIHISKAVEWDAEVIFSVPCCQHELNSKISSEPLEPVLKYGILKERMSALITDGIRANLLESKGYSTQILEFIDMEHTPKNLLDVYKRQERKVNGSYGTYKYWEFTADVATSLSRGLNVAVPSGTYYRVRGYHAAKDGTIKESTSTLTSGILIK